ncbi:hypothetical protein DEI93_01885 [Curtobacterium sp. MCBD17_035]|uniref:hypothetical protein n=1 Tax=Curtobacterium sp. MCBD17_035 TaxID=2175673 RepID=UPI000DAA00BB|nr:hypothetical protein [Curtobacterium sp. MCBD17_035]WIB67816.1 hypothetical protein DEI93_01885 [Curtobacterium sp. MCBD17_035]
MGADHFAITVPRTWFELPVRPEHRDDAISALVQERVGDQPTLREHRTEIVRILRRFARSAWDSGARYCAAFAEPSDDGIVSGALTVSMLPAPGGDDDPLTALTDRVAMLADRDSGDDEAARAHVDLHDLPRVGRVPRTWGISRIVDPSGQRSFPVATMQTFVPMDDQVALVSVASPAVDLAEALFDLFEAVTDTFELIDAGASGATDREAR